jgi:hypothetical protein
MKINTVKSLNLERSHAKLFTLYETELFKDKSMDGASILICKNAFLSEIYAIADEAFRLGQNAVTVDQ